MGAVYAAEHLGTERRVAVKVILPELVRQPEALERFRREARAAGRLRHPNVVDVTDFGVCRVGGDEVAYLVMEYLEGTTLRGLLDARGALPLEVAVSVVEQVALALETAHAAGVVHRDLKPDNIWLVPDGRGGNIVRVLDFGIAKLRARPADAGAHAAAGASDAETETIGLARPPSAAGAAPAADAEDETLVATLGLHPTETPSTAQLTTAGTTLGTPAYMSPEQCRGEEVGARSDIYSLGVVTFETLAGMRPFQGRFPALVLAHQHEPPPLSLLAPVGRDVAAVVARALAKSPGDRFPSARAMAGSLAAAAEGTTVLLRRSAALYADQLPFFLRLSARAALPGIWVVLLSLPLALAVPKLGFLVGFAGCLGWMIATTRSNAFFASAVDAIRRNPLGPPTVGAVVADVRRRLGVSPSTSRGRFFLRLFWFYIRSEMGALAGAGDLAFLIAFLEGRTWAEAASRCAVLVPRARARYNAVRAVIFAGLLLPIVAEAAAFHGIASALGARRLVAATVAVVGAGVAIPLNALFFNPVFSTALALLYFRARQANGEDVPLAAVSSGRL